MRGGNQLRRTRVSIYGGPRTVWPGPAWPWCWHFPAVVDKRSGDNKREPWKDQPGEGFNGGGSCRLPWLGTGIGSAASKEEKE